MFRIVLEFKASRLLDISKTVAWGKSGHVVSKHHVFWGIVLAFKASRPMFFGELC